MVGYSRTKSLTLLGGVLAALLGAPLVPVLTAEDDLAHADGLRGDFHALVLVGEVQGLLKAQLSFLNCKCNFLYHCVVFHSGFITIQLH